MKETSSILCSLWGFSFSLNDACTPLRAARGQFQGLEIIILADGNKKKKRMKSLNVYGHWIPVKEVAGMEYVKDFLSLAYCVSYCANTYYAGKQIRDLLAFCTEKVLLWSPENWTERVGEIQKSIIHQKYIGHSECNGSYIFPWKI